MKSEPFIPEPLPPSDIDWISHITLIDGSNLIIAA
jgi:hypothetical protein